MSFLIVEILGRSANDSVLIDDVVLAHLSAFKDRGVGHDDAVVANFNSSFDVCKWLDFNIVANLCGWVNVC